jgi:radical SAM protein with 4Fe4S-binding SPASM domain
MCGRRAKEFQSFDMSMSMITHFKSLYSYIEEITLHGWGEGTIHPKFIEILQYFNSFPLLRKYFVTNGSTLSDILDSLFDYHVDVVAVSLDGATASTNDAIRQGGRFKREITSLKKLVAKKMNHNLNFPYVNLVFTAMQRNIHELTELITICGDIGIPEVKVVYLTVFQESLLNESLIDKQDIVRRVFDDASQRAQEIGVHLKLPEIQGECEAGTLRHKQCPFPWRDLFIGSDGFIRLCQSSASKLGNIMEFKSFDELWNSKEMQMSRRHINDDVRMPYQCLNCYHSTCANWNIRNSFIQIKNDFV